MSASRRTFTEEYSLLSLLPVSLSPQWAQMHTASAGDPSRLPWRSGPGSYEGIVFVFVLFSPDPSVHKTLCVPYKSGISFALSPVDSLQSNPQSTSLGSLTWRSELSLLRKNLCDIIIFQSVDHTQGRWELIISQMWHSYHLIVASYCLWMYNIFWDRFRSFLLIVIQQLVVISMFSWDRLSHVLLLPSCLQPTELDCISGKQN